MVNPSNKKKKTPEEEQEEKALTAFHKTLGAEQKAINVEKAKGSSGAGAERIVEEEERVTASLENQKRADEQVQQVIQEKISQAPVETAKEIPITRKAPGEKAPAFGIPLVSEIAGGAEARGQAAEKTDIFRKIQSGEATSDEIRQAKRTFGLDEIDMAVIKAGDADISKTGQLVESFAFIPRDIRKFVPAFKQPSKQVDEVLAVLNKGYENIIIWSDLANANPAGASRYISLIEAQEKENIKLESRLKLLIIQSPELQSHPEQIILIQSGITANKSKSQGKKEELQLLGIR